MSGGIGAVDEGTDRDQTSFTCSPVPLLTCSVFERALENGEGGIRTPGTLLGHTPFPRALLRPLGHLSSLTGRPTSGGLQASAE